jgi:two-component sensor histidine kinase
MGYHLIDILIGVISGIVTAELIAHAEPIARWIISKAVERLPPDNRDRFREEWLAHLDETPGTLRKLWHATGCYLGAAKVGEVLARQTERDELDSSILTMTEISDGERAQKLEMLVRELNHRVKNILAIVQSVAWQTLSANHSPAEFKRAFDGRLRAISLAHDILTQGRWGQVDFEQLVEQTLAPYQGGDCGNRAEWSGSRLSLAPNMVVPLSMVLHELSINAAKHGAFSVERGRVKIAWRTDDGKAQFTWIETNGPPVKGEIKAGFGSKLISRIVSYDLVGTAGLHFDRKGFRCTLTFPVPQLQTDELRPAAWSA